MSPVIAGDHLVWLVVPAQIRACWIPVRAEVIVVLLHFLARMIVHFPPDVGDYLLCDN